MAGFLDRAGLTRAFERLGELAQAESVVVEIAIFGGAYVVLATGIRTSTRDVDAIFRSSADVAYRLADRVAQERGLPEGWLNQSVKRYVGAPAGVEPELLPLGEYPAGGVPGLRVLAPAPEYILAMKLLANRDTLEDMARDAVDIVGLMKLCGLSTKAQLLELLNRFYPTATAALPRISARLDDILAAPRHPETSDG